MYDNHISRREFVGLTTAGIVGEVLGLGVSSFAERTTEEWDPDKPFVSSGRKLVAQPVLMYTTSQKKKATSWKSASRIKRVSCGKPTMMP